MENIIKQIELNCSLDKAWVLWTTKEGLQSFFGEDNLIDIRLNGPFEIYFSKVAPYGKRGSETCKVLSFTKNKMLSFTWNAPPSIPLARNSGNYTFVVLHFEAISKQKTKLILEHAGWIFEGKEWQETHEYFKNAWDAVLSWLENSLKQAN